MATKEELLAEAYRRGLLKGEKKTAYEEAMRRGIVQGASRRNAWGKAADVLANFNRGLLVGDEVAAGVDTAVNFLSGKPANYLDSLSKQRRMESQGMRDNRTASNLALGTGNAATLLLPGGAASTGTRGLNIARGAVAGATEGAAAGLLDAGDAKERTQAANSLALLGGGLGAIGGALAPAVKSTRASKPKRVPLEELQQAKTRAYRAAEDAQITFDSQAVDDLVSAATDELKGARLNPRLHPTASELVSEFQSFKGTNPSLSDLDEFRQYINLNRKGISDADAMMVGKLVDNIDEFIDAAGPAQIVSGNKTDPGALIRAAREANTRYKKVESVEEALERAKHRTGTTGSGGNIDNATRQELRRVLEKTRNLTPDETRALTDVVMGDTAQNVLRTVGRVSPTTGGLMALGGTLLSTATGGAGGAVPIAGFVAKTISDQMTQRKVQNLLGLMAQGGRPAAQAETEFLALAEQNPQVRKLISDLIARSRRASISAAQTSQPAPNRLATSPQ